MTPDFTLGTEKEKRKKNWSPSIRSFRKNILQLVSQLNSRLGNEILSLNWQWSIKTKHLFVNFPLIWRFLWARLARFAAVLQQRTPCRCLLTPVDIETKHRSHVLVEHCGGFAPDHQATARSPGWTTPLLTSTNFTGVSLWKWFAKFLWPWGSKL